MLWLLNWCALRALQLAVLWPAGHPFLRRGPRLRTERHRSGELASVVAPEPIKQKGATDYLPPVSWRWVVGNNKNWLPTEKVISRGFRTGVRFPSSPPKIKEVHASVPLLFLPTNYMRGIERSEKTVQWTVFERWPKDFAKLTLYHLNLLLRKIQERLPLESTKIEREAFIPLF